MSDNKYSENDPERTLITLDQLSQTIEVMTSVVNRLRQHLSEQVLAKRELEALERTRQLHSPSDQSGDNGSDYSTAAPSIRPSKQLSVVVEVSVPDSEPDGNPDKKTFH